MASQAAKQGDEKPLEADHNGAAPTSNSSGGSATSDDAQGVRSDGSAAAGVMSKSGEQVAAGSKVDEDEDPEASRTRLETFLIMFALCSGLFLAALDITIVATAVPTIVAEFNSSQGKSR